MKPIFKPHTKPEPKPVENLPENDLSDPAWAFLDERIVTVGKKKRKIVLTEDVP